MLSLNNYYLLYKRKRHKAKKADELLNQMLFKVFRRIKSISTTPDGNSNAESAGPKLLFTGRQHNPRLPVLPSYLTFCALKNA